MVNFDRGAGRVFSQRGDLGISLDDFNPLAVLSLLTPRVGRAPWQINATLNAKGFGTLTDLAVAAANDNEKSAGRGAAFIFVRELAA